VAKGSFAATREHALDFTLGHDQASADPAERALGQFSLDGEQLPRNGGRSVSPQDLLASPTSEFEVDIMVHDQPSLASSEPRSSHDRGAAGNVLEGLQLVNPSCEKAQDSESVVGGALVHGEHLEAYRVPLGRQQGFAHFNEGFDQAREVRLGVVQAQDDAEVRTHLDLG
jgi:hypothetical protein